MNARAFGSQSFHAENAKAAKPAKSQTPRFTAVEQWSEEEQRWITRTLEWTGERYEFTGRLEVRREVVSRPIPEGRRACGK